MANDTEKEFRPLTIRLTPQQRERIDQAAAANGQMASQFVRYKIEQLLDRCEAQSETHNTSEQ